MTPAELRQLASPEKLPIAVQALWHDAKGNWEKAHELAQAAAGPDGDWVHAYLHRKEGDEGNARYWYSRAGHSMPTGSLEAEWAGLASALLGRARA